MNNKKLNLIIFIVVALLSIGVYYEYSKNKKHQKIQKIINECNQICFNSSSFYETFEIFKNKNITLYCKCNK